MLKNIIKIILSILAIPVIFGVAVFVIFYIHDLSTNFYVNNKIRLCDENTYKIKNVEEGKKIYSKRRSK
jgi:hypothetical protein